MFNVTRNIPAPQCLSRKVYNHKTVVNALDGIFHGKCYLCEQGNLMDPEIEHFIPHRNRDELKYDWKNLFLACSRCNSIKSDAFENLLDCTKNEVDVFNEIVHLAGNAVTSGVQVYPRRKRPSIKVLNTVKLLDECFNSSNTGLRGITRVNLSEKLQDELFYFTGWRMKLVSARSTVQEIQEAKNKLKPMCDVSYPFSVFWRWHLLTDIRVMKKFPKIREELEF
ncbi:HNH endonuclease [Enterobacter sp. A103]|uniref:HNH endonuclease n=1 Tax=Enterobacter sp. A103 TaxID=3102785 RepID=UPI002ACAF854|nr:HNH endonuclease [Enterobacter sp. A103]MDZ5640837.1 HNH endonuclease [Enterobacter sp. A103]